MERLFVVFESSDLKFKQKEIYLSRCLGLIWLILISTMILLLADGYYNSSVNACSLDYPLWGNALAAFGDITICTIISILFSRRLLVINLTLKQNTKMMPQSTASNDNIGKVVENKERKSTILDVIQQDTTWRVLTKSTLLSFIALFTTEMSLILSGILIEYASIWCAIDTVINCWCVLLMFATHNGLYFVMCRKCEKCINVGWLSCYSCHCCCKIQTIHAMNEEKPKDVTKDSDRNISAQI